MEHLLDSGVVTDWVIILVDLGYLLGCLLCWLVFLCTACFCRKDLERGKGDPGLLLCFGGGSSKDIDLNNSCEGDVAREGEFLVRLVDFLESDDVVDKGAESVGLGVGGGHRGNTVVDRGESGLLSGNSLVQGLLQDFLHKHEGGFTT